MTRPISRSLFLFVAIAASTAACSAGATSPPAASLAESPAAATIAAPVTVPADFPFGSWTTTITREDLQAAGIPDEGLAENAGDFTLTMSEDGSWQTTQVSEVDLRWPIFRGTWVATGSDGFRQDTTFPPDFAGDSVNFTWKVKDGALVLKVVNPPDPVLPILMETHPWQPAG